MAYNFLINLLISIALSVISSMLAPRAKAQKPDEVQDLQAPTAEAGRPIPVAFGTVLIESPNVLWYGDTRTQKAEM